MKITELKRKIKQRNADIETSTSKDIGFQIGKLIEHARALKCLTQAELAARVGTKQSSISRIESGSSVPSISFLVKIAAAFNTDLISPKFAFMEHVQNERIDYHANASETSVISPYFSAHGISESKASNIVMK